jgi:hypothetical protein
MKIPFFKSGCLAVAAVSALAGCSSYLYRDTVFDKLNLAPVCDMGFEDPQGYDGKGGWFDQGPQSDLSGFKSGTFEFAGIPFYIVDPQLNAGKGVIVLAGSERPNLTQTVMVPTGNASACGYFYLLHSAGWLPAHGDKIGQITFYYADGTSSVQNIVSGEDVTDWYNPYDLPNGVVAWTKPARGARYGVFLSEFRTAGKPIASVEFKSERNAVWAIVGATLCNRQITIPRKHPLTVSASSEWKPFVAAADVKKGSALDLSYMLDAPAGKYGFLKVRDGHFYFEKEPDVRVRFYGTNMCYSANFPTHEEADRIAAELASTGYNVVRFHHYDSMLTEFGSDSVTPDPERWDRMEYFIAACEKRGMYIVIDLFSYREIRAGEIPEIDGAVRAGFKALPPVLESAMNNWKTFARTIMTHKNPYTGKTLAEDPALVGVCPVNEDPLGTVWRSTPDIAAIYDGLFDQWKKNNGIVTNNYVEEQAATSRFLNEIQLNADIAYENFLRNELSVRAPLTGANCLVAISLTEPRSHYDYVDNHIYWDHPSFMGTDWSMPYRYHQLSAIEASAYVPRTMFPTRIKGLPFTVTEWNYCNPNRFRAEGAALMTAYASLQDWDGLYRFAHSHNIENLQNESAATGFDLATDPISQITERVAAIMFLRSDVAPAKGFVTCAVDSTNGYRVLSGWSCEGFEEPIELLGLCTGVGSVWAEGEPVDSVKGAVTGSSRFADNVNYVAPTKGMFNILEKRGVIPSGYVDADKGVFISDTGEIVLDARKGNFSISTSRGEWFVTNNAASIRNANASVVTKDGPQTVAVVTLDGRDLARSERLLVIHVTEQVNSDEKFDTNDMTILTEWGDLPHLMRAGKATLSVDTAVALKAWALNLKGERVREVPVTHKNGIMTITLDNTVGGDATLAYELAVK